MPLRFVSLPYAPPYRFRFQSRIPTCDVELPTDGNLIVFRKSPWGNWRLGDVQAGQVVRAWNAAAFCGPGNRPGQLAFPFDVKAIAGFGADGCARFEVCGDFRPPPAGLSPREILGRHFTWMRFRDPVHGGFFPPSLTPGRIFVHLFDPEPLFVPQRPLPEEVVDAVAAWRTAAGPQSAVTLIIDREQEDGWRRLGDGAGDIDILVADGGYPSHHPGLAFARGIYPYDFSRCSYAWTDFETLRLLSLALRGDPESARMRVGVLGSKKAGIARVVPFSRVCREEIDDFPDSLLVQGGLLTGDFAQGGEVAAWPQHRAWTFLRASDRREFLWFMNPGFRRDSSSPLFVSRFLPFAERELGADLRGEKRFCIACNRCESHCPVGLDPQHLWKCLSRGYEEEADAHGLGRCMECGLCAYACPSKIELLDELRSARARRARRMAAQNQPEERP